MIKTEGHEALTLKGTQTESSPGKIEVVVQTGLRLARETDLHSLVQSATDAGRQLCGAEFGAFFYNVIDAAGESYLLYTISGVEPERFSQFPMPRNTAVFAPTFEGTGVVRSGDITKDPRYGKSAPYYGMPKGHLPVRSYLAVPVMAHSGEVLGGLFYGHSEVDVFEQEAEDLVAVVAAQASVGIENFRLREELNRKIKDLEKAEGLYKNAGRDAGVLAAIVASSEDAIISKDLTGRIMSWNDAAARLFGYSAEEILGSSILKLIPEELHAEEPTILSRIRAGERIEHFETVRVKKNGERLDVSLSISPVRDETGTIVGASKILRDISHRKQLEKSIIQAEKIAATGRMAATIAHEINNPLEAVVNLLYLVKVSAESPDDVRQYAAVAEGEVARVSHIARQTLGYYRENTAAVLANISELAGDAITVYEPRCRTAQIRIEGRLRATKRIVMRTGELMQVISNLIANAIYAMPHGGVLTIATEDVEGGVELTIGDTGVGIPAEKMGRIFDAFYTTRGSFGTGIGLFVAKQFVEGHGGRISVKSETEGEHRGTRLAIFLPERTPYAGGEELAGGRAS
jgi:PAS domain S-box-containing protein